MPIVILPRFLLSLISLSLLGVGIYLAISWYEGYDVFYRDGAVRHFRGAPAAPCTDLIVAYSGARSSACTNAQTVRAA